MECCTISFASSVIFQAMGLYYYVVCITVFHEIQISAFYTSV